jgi:hypothetical protein
MTGLSKRLEKARTVMATVINAGRPEKFDFVCVENRRNFFEICFEGAELLEEVPRSVQPDLQLIILLTTRFERIFETI